MNALSNPFEGPDVPLVGTLSVAPVDDSDPFDIPNTDLQEKPAEESDTLPAVAVAETPPITFRDRALPMIELGNLVIPLTSRNKDAFQPNWQQLASKDPSQVEAWAKLYPDANCGCVAKAELGGTWFFEYDSNSVADRVYADTHKKLMPTFRVQSSPNRGHLYFRHNVKSLSVGNIAQSFVIGGDWSARMHNTYVVSPLSIHPKTGLPYEVKSTAEIVEAPDWFLDWMLSQKISKKKIELVPRDENNLIPHGYIHDMLVVEVGNLCRRGYGLEAREEALLLWAHDNCAPPLDEDKIRQVARSTSGWKQGNPLAEVVFHGGKLLMCSKTDLHLEDEPDEKIRLRKVFDEASRTIETHEPRIVVLNTLANLRQMEYLSPGFPKPLTSKSLWGLAGDFVEIAYPTTVASREMLLFQVLPMLGVVAGKKFYAPFGSDRHYGTVWTLNIARTADGKGSVKNIVLDALRCVDSYLFKNGLKTNITSGEGLARVACGNGMVNSMTRLLWVMPEMAMLFNSMHREGSVLSHMLREAYDANQLENERSDKRKSYVATNYLLGMMGTTSPAELRTAMPTIDWHNGVANRFLWNVGARTKKLNTSRVSPKFGEWAQRLHNVMGFNNQWKEEQNVIDYSADGLDCWNAWCDALPEEDEDTLFGLSQGRVKPNCLRVAVLYALTDEERVEGGPLLIGPRHIEAGIEIVSRSADSTAYYLNAGTGKPSVASDSEIKRIYDEVARKARETGSPEITRTEVTRMFRNKTEEQKDGMMIAANMHLEQRVNPAGRGAPIDVWCVNQGR